MVIGYYIESIFLAKMILNILMNWIFPENCNWILFWIDILGKQDIEYLKELFFPPEIGNPGQTTQLIPLQRFCKCPKFCSFIFDDFSLTMVLLTK